MILRRTNVVLRTVLLWISCAFLLQGARAAFSGSGFLAGNSSRKFVLASSSVTNSSFASLSISSADPANGDDHRFYYYSLHLGRQTTRFYPSDNTNINFEAYFNLYSGGLGSDRRCQGWGCDYGLSSRLMCGVGSGDALPLYILNQNSASALPNSYRSSISIGGVINHNGANGETTTHHSYNFRADHRARGIPIFQPNGSLTWFLEGGGGSQ